SVRAADRAAAAHAPSLPRGPSRLAGGGHGEAAQRQARPGAVGGLGVQAPAQRPPEVCRPPRGGGGEDAGRPRRGGRGGGTGGARPAAVVPAGAGPLALTRARRESLTGSARRPALAGAGGAAATARRPARARPRPVAAASR